ncbi:MAG: nucleotidyl transferase AbiEii/AbiGii toxin family protein [Gammaproteobacteria bacterium]|nr:nucleotidyl transferase AbiEii/AbiGii toxin family protein [Gammaproteobacteria bacterium]MDE0366317.1 nucleotidyl transferase AbiEii/AbiGii toxin family protein [Gammaproteobacteria bacterium]
MEKLTLPEPASSLWPRVRPILDDLASRRPDIRHLFSVGGGTILASRWGHRRSQDIDVLAKQGCGLRRALETDYSDDFVSLCERAGASEIMFVPFTATLTVSFPEGDWDLSELDPLLPGHESLAVVDGAEIQTLSNNQILAGKLVHRGFQGLARDIFDLAVALSLDPTAFEQAAGLLTPTDTELLIQEIRGTAGAYRRTAPGAIHLTDPRWSDLVLQAPEAVAQALERLSRR